MVIPWIRSGILVASACLSSACAQAAEVTPAAQRESLAPQSAWVGFAVGYGGRIFKSGPFTSEDAARSLARVECENKIGGTCRAISVPQPWSVSAVRCGDNETFVAGMPEGSATPLAMQKAALAGSYDCEETFTY